MGVGTVATTAEGAAVRRRPRPADALAAVLGLLVVAAAHVAVSLDAVAPVQTKDEIGYLAAARLLATGEGAGLLTPTYAGGYAAGWGLLTAPLWWLTSHPPTVYAASVGLDVLLAVLLMLPATAVARRLGLGTPHAVLAATVCGVASGRLGYTGYALPEGLLTVQLTTVAWLLLRLHAPPAGSRRTPVAELAGLAVLLAWLPTTHARFLPATALALLVLAVWSASRRSVPGALAVALGGLGAAAGWRLNAHVEAVLYGDVARVDLAADQLGGLRVGDVLVLSTGHAWYAAVAWLGLTLLGWCAAVQTLHRSVRPGIGRGSHPAVDRGAGPAAGAGRAAGPWLWLVLAAPLQLGVGAAYLSGRLDVGGRVDQLVYGRYGDPMWFVLALVGAAWLLATPRPRPVVAAAGLALVVLAPATWLVLRANADRVQGFVQLNVPGVQAWAWRVDDRFVVPWAPATLLAAVVLVLLGAAAVRGAPAGPARTGALALTGLVLLAAALVAEQRNIEPRDAWIRQLFQVRALVDARPEGEVLLVVDRPLLLSGNALQWWLADRRTTVVEPDEVPASAPPETLLVGPSDLPVPGATVLGRDPSGTYAVWELPSTRR